MKISLCMICGNEKAIIEACLESSKDAFDELCLVVAVGDTHPDGTVEKAEQWCKANGKDFRFGLYKNRVHLPHVDDFGAARNKSFDLASGDWLMWLDCDDYLDEINCKRIREAVKTDEFDALFCTYKVAKEGAEIQRERLIRKDFGRWKNAIHETCVITGRVGACPQITVYHRDHGPKNKSSAKRNATILQAVLEDAPRHFFYLQSELKMLGRKDEAKKAGLAALALLDEDRAEERYNVLLNLSELQPELTEARLLEAVSVQPHRREAYAYLSQKALIDGRVSDAVSFFRLMDSLPLPSPLPWTHQGIFHGWARNYLKVKILRASGQAELADQLHVGYLADEEYQKEVSEHELRN